MLSFSFTRFCSFSIGLIFSDAIAAEANTVNVKYPGVQNARHDTKYQPLQRFYFKRYTIRSILVV